MSNTLIVIAGPTATGKSDLAIAIARLYNTEIISADSRQIYRELRIGTAIPSAKELNLIKHYFIQTHSIYDYYNASMFEQDVSALLSHLFRSHKLVVMVGGSGLYIHAVCHGIDDLPEIDKQIRHSLQELFEKEGIEPLRMLLKKNDPQYYAKADLKNPKRILKALEICMMTGRPYSTFLSYQSKKREYNICKIGLDMERQMLYRRIDTRVEEMMKKGLLNEVESLYPIYKEKKLPSLNTVGYRELFYYVEGKCKLQEAVQKIKNNTHKYARKQLTWFRKDKDIQWFNPMHREDIIQHINAYCGQ